MPHPQKDMLSQLRQDLLRWEGYRPPPAHAKELVGLGPIESAFPNGVFPLGAVHELVCGNTEQATASSALVTGLLSVLMKTGGACLWISLTGNMFPSALSGFGIEPHKLIFIRVSKDKEALWVMEEALKCTGLAAVVAEVRELDFKQSRRLQLAVEQSHVTGFVLRNASKKIGSTACVARWRVKPLPSEPVDGLPGLGFPRWEIELLKVRNGHPGNWIMEWASGKFRPVTAKQIIKPLKQKVG